MTEVIDTQKPLYDAADNAFGKDKQEVKPEVVEESKLEPQFDRFIAANSKNVRVLKSILPQIVD